MSAIFTPLLAPIPRQGSSSLSAAVRPVKKEEKPKPFTYAQAKGSIITQKSRPDVHKKRTTSCFKRKAESASLGPIIPLFSVFPVLLHYILYHISCANTMNTKVNITKRTKLFTHATSPEPPQHIHFLCAERLAEIREHCHGIRHIVKLVFAGHGV